MINKKKLFKWVGGKKWIKEPLINIIANQTDANKNIDTYVEPCVGGLGSFLSVAEVLISRGIKKVYLNDVNAVLISVFRDLQQHNRSLYNEYILIEKEYEAKIPKEYRELNKAMKKEDIKKELKPAKLFFDEKRSEYNMIKGSPSIRRSALFIFLMQHVFNGVYRENKSGGLNTPYNWEPKIAGQIEKQQMFRDYRKLFENFELHFTSKDIFEFLKDLKINWNNAICYIDPPFMNEKNNELNYSKDKFTKDNQKALLASIEEYNIVNIIYSNHDFPLFVDFAEKLDLTASKYYRSNRINPNNPTRVAELLIFKEYEVEEVKEIKE